MNLETIRYYERIGLIEQPPRNPNGYRHYPEATVDRVRFIKNAQEHGFALKEVEELIGMAEARTTCAEMCGRVEQKVREIEDRIAALSRLRDHLALLLSQSPKRGPHDNCKVYACFTKPAGTPC